MPSPLKYGIVACTIIIVIDAAMLLFMDIEGSATTIIWHVVNAPALPVVFVAVQLFPPPMGESDTTSWDYLMVGLSMSAACILWGLIAAAVVALRQSPNQPLQLTSDARGS